MPYKKNHVNSDTSIHVSHSAGDYRRIHVCVCACSRAACPKYHTYNTLLDML